jgi:hypothetical protein
MRTNKRSRTLRYLGRLSGRGVISQNGEAVAEADFDFDGYFNAGTGVTASGEIQAPPEVIESLFGRPELQILTKEGLLLDIHFSDAKLAPGADAAHVDVTGPLPGPSGDWRH